MLRGVTAEALPGTRDRADRRVRVVHLAIGVLALANVGLALGLVLLGGDEPLGTRVVRFWSYFTVLTSSLVGVTSLLLARDPSRDGPVWRAARLDAVMGIVVVALVYEVLLRGTFPLEGWDRLTDPVFHVVVPWSTLAAWLWLGPRGRVGWRDVPRSLVYPLAFLGWTLLHGAVTGWYPYPFLDVDALGYGTALLNCLGVTGLFGLVAAALVRLDRTLPRR